MVALTHDDVYDTPVADVNDRVFASDIRYFDLFCTRRNVDRLLSVNISNSGCLGTGNGYRSSDYFQSFGVLDRTGNFPALCKTDETACHDQENGKGESS